MRPRLVTVRMTDQHLRREPLGLFLEGAPRVGAEAGPQGQQTDHQELPAALDELDPGERARGEGGARDREHLIQTACTPTVTAHGIPPPNTVPRLEEQV